MNVEDIFGFRNANLETVRLAIETAVGMRFDAHESSYVPGGDYYRKSLSNGTTFRLMQNHDRLEEDWAEEDYKDAEVILYLFSPTETEAAKRTLLQSVPGIIHLQTSLTTESGLLKRIKHVDGKEVVFFEKQLPVKQG